MSNSLQQHHGLQHDRLPCPSLSPGVCSNSCPLSCVHRCYPAISSSVTPSPPALNLSQHQFSSVQVLSHVQLSVTPWTAACQASLSITNSQSLLKLTSIELVMPSSHLILCHPLLLLPPIPSSIRVFSNESTLGMRWPKYWSFSYNYCIIIVRIFSQYKLSVF